MSFQHSATVTAAKELKTAFEASRDAQLQEIPSARDTEGDGPATAANDQRRQLIGDLTPALVAIAETAVRKVPGSRYAITVTGNRDPGPADANLPVHIAVSVTAYP